MTPAPAPPPRPPAPAIPPEQQKAHDDAKRFARLGGSESKLYNEAKVADGRKARDIYERLKEDIERGRQMYQDRVPAARCASTRTTSTTSWSASWPEAMRLRARLFSIREGRPAEAGPDGPPSVPHDPRQPASFYLACGYLPAGPRAVRLDRLEHAAAVASRLSRAGPFLPPRELPSLLGCRPDEVRAVLAAIGYVERDGRFERRSRSAIR